MDMMQGNSVKTGRNQIWNFTKILIAVIMMISVTGIASAGTPSAGCFYESSPNAAVEIMGPSGNLRPNAEYIFACLTLLQL